MQLGGAVCPHPASGRRRKTENSGKQFRRRVLRLTDSSSGSPLRCELLNDYVLRWVWSWWW
uniref:Uncharacterized protein n=1 Tax=Aegilops tauschii subsp. strangulata TaxID=200361 RepID=A0A453KB70_AEGTS